MDLLRGLGVLLMTLVQLVQLVWTEQLFYCHGDVCNRNGTVQFCDEIYKHCRHCSEISSDCFTEKMLDRCKTWCKADNDRQNNETVSKLVEKERLKGCPALQPIPNGYSNASGRIQHGEHIAFFCHPEYKLVGPKAISCGDFGAWSGDAPHCSQKGCQPLPLLQSGHWSITESGNSSYTAGTQATFSCSTGYDGVGEMVWLCGENGNWVANGNVKKLPLCTKHEKLNVWLVAFLAVSCLLVIGVVVLIVILCRRGKDVRNNRANNDDESISPNGSSESIVKNDVKNEETVPLVPAGGQAPPSAPTEPPSSHVQSYGKTKKEQGTQVTVKTRPWGTQTENPHLTTPSGQQATPIVIYNNPTISQNAETSSKSQDCKNRKSTEIIPVHKSTQYDIDETTTHRKMQSNKSSYFSTSETGDASVQKGTQVEDHTVPSEIVPSTEPHAPTVRLNEKLSELDGNIQPESSDECPPIALSGRDIELADIKGHVGTILQQN